MAMIIFSAFVLLSVSVLFGPNVTSRTKLSGFKLPTDSKHDSGHSLNHSPFDYAFSEGGSDLSHFKPEVIDANENLGQHHTIKEIYKLGYNDGIRNYEYGSSIPSGNYDVLTNNQPPPQAPHESFESNRNYGYDYSHDSSSHKRKNKVGFGTIISLLALGRIIKDSGFTSNGNFDFNHLLLN